MVKIYYFNKIKMLKANKSAKGILACRLYSFYAMKSKSIFRENGNTMNPSVQTKDLRLPAIAFLLSGAMLMYEILLTRMASVLLTSQYVFIIMGISLLGISFGAVVEYRIARRRESTPGITPGLWLTAVGLALAGSLFLLVKLGAEQGKLILVMATAVPFAVSGFAFSRLFRLYAHMSGALYAADLIGAAAGALIVPVFLPAAGPVVLVLSGAAAIALFGCVFAAMQKFDAKAVTSIVLAIALSAFAMAESNQGILGPIPVGKDHDKDLYRLVHMLGVEPEIVDSRWSTFGRTDLVRFGKDSTAMSIFIDGAAGASMLRFTGDFQDTTASFAGATHQFGAMVPLLTLAEQQKDSALIIGPGGGRDVLIALGAGFKNIAAVEVNPEMVQLVRDYRDFNGGIYTDFENVHVRVAEGRDFLRHSNAKYDLIMLLMPITKSSRSMNAFALSENYLFTKEAFQDYYDHLTGEGSVIIMAHGMSEIAKILTTAVAVLQDRGLPVEAAMDRVYILGSETMPLFGMRRMPLQIQESRILHAAAHYTLFDCSLSYIPGVEQQLVRMPISTAVDAGIPMMNPVFLDLASGRMPFTRLTQNTGFNLEPVTDDRPFFFQYSFDLPPVISSLFWLAIAVLVGVLLVPGHYFRMQVEMQEGRAFKWWLPLFFVAIGAGYIIIELALFQKLVFYLGDPARSLAILLAALLVGSGVGSFLSRNAMARISVAGGYSSAGVAVLLLFVMPALYAMLHDATLPTKQLVAAALLFIQGIPMGFMFPVGLRAAERAFGRAGVPWMWAINGSASVAGSAIAVALAMMFGYTWSLLFGAFCYIVAGTSMFKMNAEFTASITE